MTSRTSTVLAWLLAVAVVLWAAVGASPGLDDILHAVASAVVVLALRPWLGPLGAVLAATAVGIGLEVVQLSDVAPLPLVGGDAQWSDLVADALGIAWGSALAAAPLGRWREARRGAVGEHRT